MILPDSALVEGGGGGCCRRLQEIWQIEVVHVALLYTLGFDEEIDYVYACTFVNYATFHENILKS